LSPVAYNYPTCSVPVPYLIDATRTLQVRNRYATGTLHPLIIYQL